jgi:hypothetical protein
METHSTRLPALFGVLLVAVMLAGCPQQQDEQDDSPLIIDTGSVGSDVAGPDTAGDGTSTCDGGDCRPEPPRGTPTDECPGGQFAGAEQFDGRGICRPAAPEMTGWECPDKWRGRPAYLDADDEADLDLQQDDVEGRHEDEPRRLRRREVHLAVEEVSPQDIPEAVLQDRDRRQQAGDEDEKHLLEV